MASAGEKALHTALKKRVFDPVYYLFGEDNFLKEQAARDIIKAAADPATRDFNLEVRRASEIGSEGLHALLGTPPMLAEPRVVVLGGGAIVVTGGGERGPRSSHGTPGRVTSALGRST